MYNNPMHFESIYKRLIISILIIVHALSFAGCGLFFDDYGPEGMDAFVTTNLDRFFSSGCETDLNSLCSRKYDVSGIPDEQMELFRYSLRGCLYEIIDSRIREGNDSGVCIVDFVKVPRAIDLKIRKASAEDYKKAIDRLDKESVRVTFRLTKDVYGDWMFDELDDFYDSFLRAYDGLEYLDDKGIPVYITEDYLTPFLVESVWYDPLMNNPLKGNSLEKPVALVNVFCFNQKLTVSLTAKLFRGKDEVAEFDVAVDDDIMLKCDFDAGVYTKSEYFREGVYHVELYSGDIKVASSPDIKVR